MNFFIILLYWRFTMDINNIEYLLNSLKHKGVPIITKKRHTYLTYHGFEENITYILKKGVIKNSIILQDGREFNISYMTKPNVVNLLRDDEISKDNDQPFNIRIESDVAEFYKMDRIDFWNMVNNDEKLRTYVSEYYKNKLSQNITHLQMISMNGKSEAVCAFIYELTKLFGKHLSDQKDVYIDFIVTNEDIASFCGINSQSSVNRILTTLRQQKIIDIKNHHIIIKDMEHLLDNVAM